MRYGVFILLILMSPMKAAASALLARAQIYDSQVSYDVYRNDEPVGRYLLSFNVADDRRLEVSVDMYLKTRIFGLFSYEYSYVAREVWNSDDRLEALEVRVLSNGKERQVKAQRSNDSLSIINARGETTELAAELLTTHHWFDGILRQREVINTINGEVIELDISREQQASWRVDGEPVPVTGYRLGGDLADTLSWYDQKGRWRGLSFSARDGSNIEIRWQGAQLQDLSNG